MAISKPFCIAVAGPTIDGREIQPEWLEQMAASYDPKTYTARINCEHIAGYSPDRPFNAYGSVLSLSTRDVDLTINDKVEKTIGLFAIVDANDQLVDLNKTDQKIFSSCEINTNFAGKGTAYLVGLAATDRPASLGTEPLKFAALARPNHFTLAHEATLEFTASTDGADISSAVRGGILSAFTTLFKQSEKPKEEPKPPVQPANDNSFDMAAFATVMGDQIALAVKPANDAVAGLTARFDTLEQKLKTEEQPGSFTRQPASGGNAQYLTDC